MLAPRATLLTNNAEDNCCFRAAHALPPLLEAAGPVYQLYGVPGNLRYHINHDPGTHNFGLDNRQQLYAAFADYFYAADTGFQRTEIPSEKELKTKEQLFVELPADNLDFNSLAQRLSSRITHTVPESSKLIEWQEQMRPVLKEVVRAHDYHTLAVEQSTESTSTGMAVWRWLRIGGDWTVPAVEISTPQSDPSKLAIVISDEGRAVSELDTTIFLSAGYRVLAMDPFYFGESKIAERDYLYATLISSIGDRPLGIQASQILSVARWARREQDVTEIKLIADGPRTSLIALVAGALSADAINAVETYGSPASLRELIEQNKGMNEIPEALCFGLLAEFDITHLAAMVVPRPVVFHNASERVRKKVLPSLRQLTK